MGLDQYAYVGTRVGQRQEYYLGEGEYDPHTHEWVPKNPTVTKPREIAYWRKHPNLQGWMRQLWKKKGYPGGDVETPFNNIELELSWQDIDQLQKDIELGAVANLNTTGFFFGEPSDDYYREKDLQFCLDAKTEIFLGFKVFYLSSW